MAKVAKPSPTSNYRKGLSMREGMRRAHSFTWPEVKLHPADPEFDRTVAKVLLTAAARFPGHGVMLGVGTRHPAFGCWLASWSWGEIGWELTRRA
jgi:hypothetical protein